MKNTLIVAAALSCVLGAWPVAAQLDPATDPERDDWQAERFVAPAMAQLERLGDWIAVASTGEEPPSLAGVFAKRVRFSTLAAEGAVETRSGCRTIRDRNEKVRVDREPLEALAELAESLPSGRATFDFKLLSYEPRTPRDIATSVRVEVRTDGVSGSGYLVAEWYVMWHPGDDELAPRIKLIRKKSVDRVEADRPLFSERTAAVLGELAADPALRWGAEYWYGRVDNLGEPNLMGHHGIAVGDVNGDGLDDVYVAAGTGLPNRLLVQQDDGTVRDVAHEAGVAWLDDTKGVLLVDTDDDGDRDLVTAIGNTIVLAKNDGEGTFDNFVRMKAPTSAPFYSLTAADFDLDGDIDLYGVRYIEQSYGVSVPLPFHDANNGPSNHLMRNDGEDRFVDVTAAVGLDHNNRRFSLAASWADYDADGDPDLYVANDFGRNNLYRNDNGKFVDVAAKSGAEDQAAGMGVAWADYDADGDLDLHVTNMFSAAGKRIAYQPRFQAQIDSSQREAIRRHSLGNSLFVNDDGSFRQDADAAGVRMGRWGWGAIFVDWDNDGYEDLLTPNGFVTGALEDDL